MSVVVLQSGTEIAADLREASNRSASELDLVRTTGDLLGILQQNPPRSFTRLKTVCGLLGMYLDQPADQILFDTIDEKRGGFRRFLVARKHTENTIRTYVNDAGELIKTARQLGWHPMFAASNEWKALILPATEMKVAGLVRHFSRITRTPAEVTVEAVDLWGEARLEDGVPLSAVTERKSHFWKLLRRTGWTSLNPSGSQRSSNYGVPLEQLPPGLQTDVIAALKWKQAEFAPGRPKDGKIRKSSALSLESAFCCLAGYAINIRGLNPASLAELLKKEIVEGFVEWAINERGLKGWSVKHKLVMIAAVVLHHRSYSSQDLSWFRQLTDGIPIEDASARKERKARKYVEYSVLETIPRAIGAERISCERGRQPKRRKIARLAMEELMVRWLLVLPWRQRNVRECRVTGDAPNVFKGRIPQFSELDRPAWVVEEESRNPEAEFWQVRFSAQETKTGIPIHFLLPKQLIAALEEYLSTYRPQLLGSRKTNTLFLNSIGAPLTSRAIQHVVGNWSFRVAGVRTTPHLFRDAVAFKWLKEHPKDYLTLSKMLWHKNVQTTISIYGARFNESSGVSAMESWLEERAMKTQ